MTRTCLERPERAAGRENAAAERAQAAGPSPDDLLAKRGRAGDRARRTCPYGPGRPRPWSRSSRPACGPANRADTAEELGLSAPHTAPTCSFDVKPSPDTKNARRVIRRASGDEQGGRGSPTTRRCLPGGREHVGLRIVRLGGEARRSAARRVLAAATADAFAALQTILPANTGKIPEVRAHVEAVATSTIPYRNALQLPIC